VIAIGLNVILAVAISASPAADEHLLAGAGAFRDGRFEAALVEFRVAERLGASDATGYAGAALVKLGRPEEALEAFAAAPRSDDSLLTWYHAVACYDARLYTCAARLLDRIDLEGPRASRELARLRAEVARVLEPEPTAAAVEWYLARCEERHGTDRGAVAAAYCREAATLGARRQDRHGVSRATALLARLGEATAAPAVTR
jgi:tetratricopeptide (TPR) repeat protein